MTFFRRNVYTSLKYFFSIFLHLLLLFEACCLFGICTSWSAHCPLSLLSFQLIFPISEVLCCPQGISKSSYGCYSDLEHREG